MAVGILATLWGKTPKSRKRLAGVLSASVVICPGADPRTVLTMTEVENDGFGERTDLKAVVTLEGCNDVKKLIDLLQRAVKEIEKADPNQHLTSLIN